MALDGMYLLVLLVYCDAAAVVVAISDVAANVVLD
jgi:hypothetical protein